MTADPNAARGIAYRAMTLAALVLIAVAYFSPIWWVSLTAPQYPAEAFPSGIRIHFHFDSVQNGCAYIPNAEIYTGGEALNCKHEMDTINHYVGMYPISAGAPVERAMSPFLVSLVGVVMIAFMLNGRGLQAGVVATGGVAIAAWAAMALFGEGGVTLLSPNYVADMAGTLDLDPEDYAGWTALTAIEESYGEAMGRYFGHTATVRETVALMLTSTYVVYALMIAAALALVVGLLVVPAGPWLLGLIPAILPVAFVIDYAAWLYWFGHTLNDMGAFTVKPFMPTVFGQGKVAQFATFSYPHYGYGLLVAAAVLMLLATLIRRKQLVGARPALAPAAAQPVAH